MRSTVWDFQVDVAISEFEFVLADQATLLSRYSEYKSNSGTLLCLVK